MLTERKISKPHIKHFIFRGATGRFTVMQIQYIKKHSHLLCCGVIYVCVSESDLLFYSQIVLFFS